MKEYWVVIQDYTHIKFLVITVGQAVEDGKSSTFHNAAW